ncbi:MAG: zinc-binding alcohol dehydrogenase [Planctomycetota bacterium]|nr:zinc-binding alcohol dehydrogenase [Planctomycetota bacterium]
MQAKRVFFPELNRVDFGPVEVGEPVEKQLLVRVLHSAISPGTELANLRGDPNTPRTFPMATGYSACAVVEAVGPGVADLEPGQRLICAANHQSRALVARRHASRIGERLDSAMAAPYRLASIALQGVRKARVQLGQRVAVVGLGPIGNLAGQLARAAGATSVVGLDPVPWRCELARASGFTEAFASPEDLARAATPHGRIPAAFDLVIEATGLPAPIKTALGLAKKLGQVILLGSPRGITDQVDFYNDVHKKGIAIVGAHASLRGPEDDIGVLWSNASDERTVVELLEDGRLDMKSIVSDVMPAREAVRAYARLLDRNERLMTLVLDWSAE